MHQVGRVYHADHCAICFVDYEEAGNDCALLKCGHIFHRSCIQNWTIQQPHCPMCQRRSFIPLLLKDILKEVAWKGIEGAKKGAKGFALGCAFIGVIAVEYGIINYFYAGKWPYTDQEIDEYIKEHGVLFDLRKSEGYVRLGLTALAVVGSVGSFFLVKELNSRRNQQPEPEEIASLIDYKPWEELEEKKE